MGRSYSDHADYCLDRQCLLLYIFNCLLIYYTTRTLAHVYGKAHQFTSIEVNERMNE